MAILLREREPRQYTYVITPTGDELPEMFNHWRRLSELLGTPLTPVVGGTLNGLIEQHQMLPNFRARWCTRQLKIEPYAAWLIKQSKIHDNIVSYVGIRADEPGRGGGDFAEVPGVLMRFPLREWNMGLADVRAALSERGIAIPKRTDCARCFFQRIGEWWSLWHDHRDVFDDAAAQEERIGHTFRTPGRDSWPVALKDLGADFAKGLIPKSEQQYDMFKDAQCRICRI